MIILIGIDFHTAPIEVREKLYFGEDDLPSAYNELKKTFNEAVIISTCNRMEVYVSGLEESDQKKLVDFLVKNYQLNDEKNVIGVKLDKADLIKSFYFVYGTKAVEHLYEVAAGIKSMVIGENEILGQVKKAYQLAAKNESTGSVFNKLFQGAVAIGKKVRHQTNISSGGVSVASTSIDLIKEIYQKNSKFSLLLLGAGTVAEEVVKALTNHGDVKLTICNRTQKSAEKIIENYRGRWVSLESRYEEIVKADVVIASTSMKGYVIEHDRFRQAMDGLTKFIFFIDLSLPRNIEPKINNLSDTALYTVDDLEFIVAKNLEKRHLKLGEAKRLINLAVEELNEWLHQRKARKI